jgi:hypothetical protein
LIELEVVFPALDKMHVADFEIEIDRAKNRFAFLHGAANEVIVNDHFISEEHGMCHAGIPLKLPYLE